MAIYAVIGARLDCRLPPHRNNTPTLICCYLSLCIYIESLPYISPDGINAILSDTVEFRCIVPSDTDQIGWFINGTLFTEDVLANRGITINKLSLIRKTNASFALLSIQARAVNNNTTLQCRIVTSSDQVARSEEVLLQIQGKCVLIRSGYHKWYLLGPLAPPTSLETTHFNSTHDLLVWEDPYTLDLTDIDPDITGYTITITMENPPPLHPYNHSLTLDELDDTRTESFTISSSDGPQFPFPRYAFPMWLRVSVENPAGLGEMSEDLKYSIQPQTDCTRISGELYVN